MKHAIMTDAWSFSLEPFPAYRTELVYGRNKRDREFLPVKDVPLLTKYTVKGEYGHSVLHECFSKEEAEAFFFEKAGTTRADNFGKFRLEVGRPTLPEGQFRVIKTREKGTIMVVPGSDDTNRCLLFVGCEGGFRGGVGVAKYPNSTTGTILKECSAGNACQSSVEVIVLLEVGQCIVFHSSGRRTDEVYQYLWNGSEIEAKHFSREEWSNRLAVETPPVDVEVM